MFFNIVYEIAVNNLLFYLLYSQRKKFLSNVLSTMSVNVHEEMNNSINILFDNNKQADEHEFAFDVIAEYVDNIDYANGYKRFILIFYSFLFMNI